MPKKKKLPSVPAVEVSERAGSNSALHAMPGSAALDVGADSTLDVGKSKLLLHIDADAADKAREIKSSGEDKASDSEVSGEDEADAFRNALRTTRTLPEKLDQSATQLSKSSSAEVRNTSDDEMSDSDKMGEETQQSPHRSTTPSEFEEENNLNDIFVNPKTASKTTVEGAEVSGSKAESDGGDDTPDPFQDALGSASSLLAKESDNGIADRHFATSRLSGAAVDGEDSTLHIKIEISDIDPASEETLRPPSELSSRAESDDESSLFAVDNHRHTAPENSPVGRASRKSIKSISIDEVQNRLTHVTTSSPIVAGSDSEGEKDDIDNDTRIAQPDSEAKAVFDQAEVQKQALALREREDDDMRKNAEVEKHTFETSTPKPLVKVHVKDALLIPDPVAEESESEASTEEDSDGEEDGFGVQPSKSLVATAFSGAVLTDLVDAREEIGKVLGTDLFNGNLEQWTAARYAGSTLSIFASMKATDSNPHLHSIVPTSLCKAAIESSLYYLKKSIHAERFSFLPQSMHAEEEPTLAGFGYNYGPIMAFDAAFPIFATLVSAKFGVGKFAGASAFVIPMMIESTRSILQSVRQYWDMEKEGDLYSTTGATIAAAVTGLISYKAYNTLPMDTNIQLVHAGFAIFTMAVNNYELLRLGTAMALPKDIDTTMEYGLDNSIDFIGTHLGSLHYYAGSLTSGIFNAISDFIGPNLEGTSPKSQPINEDIERYKKAHEEIHHDVEEIAEQPLHGSDELEAPARTVDEL